MDEMSLLDFGASLLTDGKNKIDEDKNRLLEGLVEMNGRPLEPIPGRKKRSAILIYLESVRAMSTFLYPHLKIQDPLIVEDPTPFLSSLLKGKKAVTLPSWFTIVPNTMK